MKAITTQNRKQDQLTQLIQLLSANEKRHFKLTHNQQGDKKYALLFDELAANQWYTPDAVSSKLGVSKKQLADDKKYLETVVLKSLRNYNDQDDFIYSHNLLCNVSLLINKYSYAIAESQIDKGIAIAEKHNWHDLTYQFYNMKMLLDSRNLAGNRTELTTRMFTSIKKARAATNFLKLQLDFEELNTAFIAHSALRIVDRTSKERNATRKFLRHPLLISKNRDAYFKKEKYSLKSKIYFMLGDFSQAVIYSEKALLLMEKFPHQLQIEAHDYFTTLCNHFHLLASTGQFKKVDAFIRKLETAYYKKMPVDSDYISKRMVGYIPLFRALYYQRRYSRGIIPGTEIGDFLANTEKKMPEIKAAVYETTWHGFLLTMANLNFLLNDMPGASRWHHMLLQEGNTRIMKQVHCISRIKLALIHAQLRNYLLLPGLVSAARYLLKKYNLGTVVETTVLTFLSKLPKIKTEEERKVAFMNLYRQIEEFSKNKETATAVRAIDYRLWIKRNI